MARRLKSIVSYNMSRIRATDTVIEKVLMSEIRKSGLKGFRRNASDVFGKPDFCWKKHRVAVFCDSAFWHGYRWGKKFKNSFKVRKKFWVNKIESNIKRDRKVNRELKKQGWVVLRFWDFQIKKNTNWCASAIRKKLQRIHL